MLASKKRLALVLPVRANTGGSELGRITWDPRFLRQALDGISAITDRSFGTTQAEVFTFSNGIFDCNKFLGGSGSTLNVQAVYNSDPQAGTPASRPKGAVLKQYLSGETTSGRPRGGFEFMPLPRWANEPNYTAGGRKQPSKNQQFNYLHNLCMPEYTLHLGLQT